MKKLFILIFLAINLIVINWNIYQKEMILKYGKTIFLELAPVDPRSLMQGDYMRLRYRIAEDIKTKTQIQNKDGYLVLSIDNFGRAEFVRFHSKKIKLNENEILLKYRNRGNILKLGAESFFFQEGKACLYQKAKYGELKVSKSGESLLIDLKNTIDF
ncbi:MAG TPA: GDYXXLXY domain-containing protein [bacterium]|nr:GDYXXLXY domain-containing protein [bacterium]HPN30304.1 GDYXXLXY domain-containing protein [bacterium]